MKVLYDDQNQPCYTIKFSSSKEKETDSNKQNKNASTKTTKVGVTDKTEIPSELFVHSTWGE